MDLQLVRKGVDFSKRRKKWFLLLALFGASSYGAYRFYHSPSVSRKRRRIVKLIGAFTSVIDVVSDSADTIGVVSKDLKEFLLSDSDEIPNSLRQISKIAQADEVSHSLKKVSEAVAFGFLRGYRNEMLIEEGGSAGNVSFTDRVMDRVLSTAGTGFVSVVAGAFARNLVVGFLDRTDAGSHSRGNGRANVQNDGMNGIPWWLNLVVCNDECKDLMANCIQVFVSTVIAAYLDKTMHINTYDELFAGLTNPNHEGKIRDTLVSVCNGAVETLVRTSHEVLTSKSANTSSSSGSYDTTTSHHREFSSNIDEDSFSEKASCKLNERWIVDKMQTRSWVNSVSSTLSVPSNRRFVIDMTGRVTAGTFKSVVEFLAWKLSDGLKSSVNVVQDRVASMGLAVVRYCSAKACVIITICLALCLHIIGSRALIPA